MKFSEIIEQASDLLRRNGRMSYRALKREFDLDDETIEDLKIELIDAKRIACDEAGRVLVWVGGDAALASETAQASRRQLSVMFCDVVGSTALSERIDPEELRDLLRTYQGVCGRIIHEYDGHVAQYLGDGLLVYFGYPRAQENAARNAVDAGLTIIRAIRQSKALQLNADEPFSVRVGIHTGPVVIGSMGDEHHQESLAVGETPNVAARIQGCAESNQLVVSDATRKVAGEHFVWKDGGLKTLKGISTPVQLWRAVESQHESLTATPGALIGREQELARIADLFAQARHGRSTFVVVTGEPGIGKSRLVDEAVRGAASEGAHRWVLRCDPRFSQSPLYPVIEFLNELSAGELNSDPRRATVAEDDIPYLDALLGRTVTGAAFARESPETRRAKTIRALTHVFHGLGDEGPAVCVWEDFHAADPSTQELFARLSATPSVAPVLHVVASRPNGVLDGIDDSRVARLVVSPLDQSHVKELAAATADGVTLSSAVLEHVVVTTDGVPLFVEEMTKMLLESDLLREVDGEKTFRDARESLAIPMTLQDSLMARLDQLPAGLALAQRAATIGREFDDALLDAVVDARLHKDGITQLVNAGLIQRIDVPPTRYRFKHALVSDTAYQSLLKSERRVYHAQIADAMERIMPETVHSQPELVAHHLTEAGNAASAIPLWQAAGEKALSRSANREALHHLDTGLNLLTALPHTAARDSQELMLRTAMGPVLIAIKGNAAPEVEMSYERARELCDGLGDDVHSFAATFGLRSYYLARADLAQSHTLGERLLDIATINRDADEQLEAHVALSNTCFFYGDIPTVQTHVDAGIALYRESMHTRHVQGYGLDPGVICLSRSAQALWHRGFPDSAADVMDDAIALAERLHHPFTTAYLYDNAAVLYQWRREGEPARRWAETAVALSTQYGFPFFRAWGLMQVGSALVELGHSDDGIAYMDEGMAIADSIGVLLMQPWFLATRAEACLQTQQRNDGLECVANGLAIVEHTGAAYAEPALHWLKGELLMLEPSGDSAAAEESLLQAKQTAAKHASNTFELRATMGLSRLWRRQGKTNKARRLLAPIYDWFTEGFDTKDLQDAKALLEELG